MNRGRVWAGAALVLLAGLTVHAVGRGWPADKAGDLLYAAFAHYLVILLRPRWPRRVTLAVALGWCVAVELLQLTSLPGEVAGVLPAARLVLGSGFDPVDLLAYALGVFVPLALGARRSP